MSVLTGSQIIAEVRQVAGDIDTDSANQGLTTTQWLRKINAAYVAMYGLLNKARVQYDGALITGGWSSGVKNELTALATFYDLLKVEYAPALVGSGGVRVGTELEKLDYDEVRFLQDKRTATGTPRSAGWTRQEGTGKYLLAVWPVPAAVLNTTGDTHSNTTVDGLASTTGLVAGMYIAGTGIPADTTISSVDSATAITISAAATATAAGVTFTFVAGLGAYCKKYPTALADSAAEPDLDDAECRWLVDLSASYGMPELGESKEAIEAVLGRLPNWMESIVPALDRYARPRVEPEEAAI